MKTLEKGITVLLCLFISFTTQLFAQKELVVVADKPYAEVQPTMWGLFFEDINFAADGGIYAELVKNRSFEFYRPLMGWKEIKTGDKKGELFILNRGEGQTNSRFLRIRAEEGDGFYGLENEGFRGMGIKKAENYIFSLMARLNGNSNFRLIIRLIDPEGHIIGEAEMSGFTDKWEQYEIDFKSLATEGKAKLHLLLEGEGMLDIDMVSLFPENTWKKRRNGMRADLVQMLADMKPGIFRFPGGCIVEGFDLTNRYQWKKTIGPLSEREQIVNRWNTEFMNRHTPDYFQSFGLGFYEYFLLSEDIGAEPLPILNCGMACQYNTGELAAMDQLGPYIQDALDLIEFANGPISSKWGRIRAEMGHPEPFHLKYLGIGNEQWGEQYIERYREFARVIREKHPEIKLVSAAGPGPEGERFDYLWGELRNMETDLVDEHFYRSPEWFFNNAGRYNNYDRNGPKVYPGEYAAHDPAEDYPSSRNTWLSALAEAAVMTGFERNADVVHMSSYAPLFAHLEAWQWRPNLIWFDNLSVIPTPNYHVQKLFSTNAGTHVIPLLIDGETAEGRDSVYASSVMDKNKNNLIIKLVNANAQDVQVKLKTEGVKKPAKSMVITTLASDDLSVYNSLEKPDNIVPVTKEVKLTGKTPELKLLPYSLTVVKIPVR